MDVVDLETRKRTTLPEVIERECFICETGIGIPVERWQEMSPAMRSKPVCRSCYIENLVGGWRVSMLALGIPAVYRDVPEDLVLPPQVQDWFGDPWSVTLLGRTGSGKTWLGTSLFTHAAREMIRETPENPIYTTCLWTDSQLAAHEMKRDIDDGKQRRYIQHLMDAPILMLDDFGAEREVASWIRSELAFVLSHRYNNQLPSIVTSNAEKLSQLVEIDARTASRLSAGIVIEMPRRDFRMKVSR